MSRSVVLLGYTQTRCGGHGLLSHHRPPPLPVCGCCPPCRAWRWHLRPGTTLPRHRHLLRVTRGRTRHAAHTPPDGAHKDAPWCPVGASGGHGGIARRPLPVIPVRHMRGKTSGANQPVVAIHAQVALGSPRRRLRGACGASGGTFGSRVGQHIRCLPHLPTCRQPSRNAHTDRNAHWPDRSLRP